MFYLLFYHIWDALSWYSIVLFCAVNSLLDQMAVNIVFLIIEQKKKNMLSLKGQKIRGIKRKYKSKKTQVTSPPKTGRCTLSLNEA